MLLDIVLEQEPFSAVIIVGTKHEQSMKQQQHPYVLESVLGRMLNHRQRRIGTHSASSL